VSAVVDRIAAAALTGDEVRAAHAEALARYRSAERAVTAFARTGLLDPDGRRLRPSGADAIVARTSLQRELEEAAHALVPATGALRAVLVEAANAKLGALAPAYGRAAAAVEAQRVEVERAFVEFIGAAWLLQEVAAAEGVEARKLTTAALEAVRDEEARADMRHAGQHEVPLALDEHGEVADRVERPDAALFGQPAFDVRGERLVQELGHVLAGGRRHGPARLSERVWKRVARAMERRA